MKKNEEKLEDIEKIFYKKVVIFIREVGRSREQKYRIYKEQKYYEKSAMVVKLFEKNVRSSNWNQR